ncbi:MAG: uncharacterized protein JWN61_573 [Pseudonocardiales bacterium]|nr:uncharacterized protein [Jatrophihabitantaceae bacterium]MCW2602438.1 uncharacterized protein [Pseudonocardiales bacterium]
MGQLGAQPHSGAIARAVALAASEPPELLAAVMAQACTEALASDGAVLSMIEGSFRLPLGASDAIAAEVEALEFTYGEGPCLDAARLGRIAAVAMPELAWNWPSFADALAATPYRGLISLPIPMADGARATMDLYLSDAAALDSTSLGRAVAVAAEVASVLQNDPNGSPSGSSDTGLPGPAWLDSPPAQARSMVWTAIGMLMGDARIPAPELLARLRAFCYTSGMSLDAVAAALVERSLAPGQVLT